MLSQAKWCFLSVFIVLASADCPADVGAAASSIASAAVQIKDAVVACVAQFDRDTCADSVYGVIKDLDDADNEIAHAIQDCGGFSSACANDLTQVVTDITAATSQISKLVIDCIKKNSNNLQCLSELGQGAKLIVQAAKDAAQALKDCNTAMSLAA